MSLKWRGRMIIFLLCLAGGLAYLSLGVGLLLFDEARFVLAVILVLAVAAGRVQDPMYWAGRSLNRRR
jgi:hypothetical protein